MFFIHARNLTVVAHNLDHAAQSIGKGVFPFCSTPILNRYVKTTFLDGYDLIMFLRISIQSNA